MTKVSTGEEEATGQAAASQGRTLIVEVCNKFNTESGEFECLAIVTTFERAIMSGRQE